MLPPGPVGARTLYHALALFGSLVAAAQAGPAAQHLKKGDDWYASAEAAQVAANILSHQSPAGGWPKNTDTTAKPYAGDPAALKPTFDNGATTDELRVLARLFKATHDNRYRAAFAKGLDHILVAQYPTGGWPQFYPPGKQYHRHITFNDNAMVRLMEFLREVCSSDLYGFVDVAKRDSAKAAFDRGIDCILRCQIRVGGRLTAWCAQHDEKDYRPRPARTYELASLSGSETVGLVRLLMSLERPSPEVVQSVQAAVAWLEAATLTGLREAVRDDPKAPKGRDKVVVQDPSAPPLWARFYEIGTNRPLFCDRDGVAKYSLSEIGAERRNGYAWLGGWPRDLLEKEYPAWKAKHEVSRTPVRRCPLSTIALDYQDKVCILYAQR
jgi:pectate lyase